MLGVLTNPAAWASLAGLLAALGVVEISQALLSHVLELVGALAGIIGIVTAMRSHGGTQ